ncbi:hypothetical protein KIW84_012919 [Lathyrus oleraceus]|uniref:Uncharacterized protein n=1 Tax=Pisum sativum TaxID=3888 RepID=A0A9D5GXB4_PEA|nr:hypothetical protein KIW84_012919 [Pisum sativum]
MVSQKPQKDSFKSPINLVAEEMFGIDNFCWMSTNAISEASRLVEVLVLQTALRYLQQNQQSNNVQQSSSSRLKQCSQIIRQQQHLLAQQ